MIVSLRATWVSVKFASPRTSWLHTKTIAVHGDGLRVEPARSRRGELHADPGRSQRHDHGVRVRTDRGVAARRRVDRRAVADPAAVRGPLYRAAVGDRASLARAPCQARRRARRDAEET